MINNFSTNLPTDSISVSEDMVLIELYQHGNLDAGATFVEKHYDEIVKFAKYHCRKVNYDFSLGQDIYSDCISEATLATYNAMMQFDFKSANIMTFISNKIMFAFKDLKRNMSKHCEREELCLEDRIAHEQDFRNMFRSEGEDKQAVCALFKCLKERSRELGIIERYYSELRNGNNHPVKAICQKTGYSKQHVGNIIKLARNFLPEQLRQEIREGYLAA